MLRAALSTPRTSVTLLASSYMASCTVEGNGTVTAAQNSENVFCFTVSWSFLIFGSRAVGLHRCVYHDDFESTIVRDSRQVCVL